MTSLVQQHQRYLEEAGRRCYYASGLRSETLDDVITAVRIAVSGRRPPRYKDEWKLLADHPFQSRLVSPGDPDRLAELRRVVPPALEGENGGADAAIVIVDDMHEPGLVHELFGLHRDDLWQLPWRWVVCGLDRHRTSYLEPPADSFFDAELRVGPLDDATAEQLLEARLAHAGEAEAPAVQQIRDDLTTIIERGKGNPRQILAAARAATLESAADAVAALQTIEAAGELGMTEVLVVRHLLDYGPASASDEELLDALGISRARTTQVLRNLEEAGLVTAFHEKSGVGRPRKLYSVRLEGAVNEP